MNLTMDRQALLSALHTVAPAVPHKSTLPVLRCVLVESRPLEGATQYSASDRLSLRATNLDLTLVATAYGTVGPDAMPLARRVLKPNGAIYLFTRYVAGSVNTT